MIRYFSKSNMTGEEEEAAAQVGKPDYDDDDDDARTMSSMSTLFRSAKGDRHGSSRPSNTFYQFDDNAAIDSLSDIFKTSGIPTSKSVKPSSSDGNTNNTNNNKKAKTRKSSDNDGVYESISLSCTNGNTENLQDQAELGEIKNDEGKTPDSTAEDDAEQEKDGIKAEADQSLYETSAPGSKKRKEKRFMSNRMVCCCIASNFVIFAGIAAIVTWHLHYKKWGRSNSMENSDTTPQSNLRSLIPTAAPTSFGHIPSPSTNFGDGLSSPTASPPSLFTSTGDDTASKLMSTPITSSLAPTANPTEDYIGPLMEFLQDNQVYFERDPMSPDFMAVQFMADEAQIRHREGVSSAYGNGLVFDERLIQRFALLTVDYALNRASLSSTSQVRDVNFDHYTKVHTIGIKEVDECSWDGVYCAEVGPLAGKVEEIRFSHSGMTGTIPPEIKLLKNMKVLDLSVNDIRGSIPESLYSIKELKELYLYKNHLTGTISNSIKNWYNITHVHLSHNELSGSIPITFKSGTLIRPVKYLNLYSNQLTGTIPNNLRFRRLVYADFGRNQFTGTLPDDIGERWVRLRFLHMDHNKFTGTIPYSYTTVGNGRVEVLSFNHNQLTGWVPGYYEHFKLLELNLHNNTFTGIEHDTCKQAVFYSGEMVEFNADCGDVCICDPYCEKC